MIVVDTSVWVDVFNDADSRPARTCVELIESGEPVALTDVIFARLLQGLGSDAEATEFERHLLAFPVLHLLIIGRLCAGGEPVSGCAWQGDHYPKDARLSDRGALCARKRPAAARRQRL